MINLDIVLADNNSYILCYAKLPEEELLFSETETNKSCRRSPHFQYSSTPIRPDKRTYKTIVDCTPVREKFPILTIFCLFYYLRFKQILHPVFRVLMMIYQRKRPQRKARF